MKYILFILLSISLSVNSQTTYNVLSTSTPCIDKVNLIPGDTLKTTDTKETFVWNGASWVRRQFSGYWSDLKNRPVIFDGTWNSLSGKPTIPLDQVQTDWNASSGLGVLLNKPATFTPSTHSHAESDITNLVTDLSGKQATLTRNTGLITYSALSNGTLALAFGTNSTVKVTPTATGSFTTTIPAAGTQCHLIILTSGTTSFTMTFGTGFKSVGTLATGTTTAKTFVVHFISDGTTVIEAGRTAAQ